MCGIAGAYLSKWHTREAILGLSTVRHLSHRGPDGYGQWINADGSIILTHYRLSIVDLTKNGDQPMQSHDGELVLVFNGEIYNHRQIRSKLNISKNGINWKGESDTETLVEAISAWGVEAALNECIGMFAFAVFDKIKKTLILARDRMGEKPVYYSLTKGALVFSSEIKVFQKLPGFKLEINRQALGSYMENGYIPGESSIYQGIFKLQPGSFTVFTQFDIEAGGIPKIIKYWDVCQISKSQNGANAHLSTKQIIDKTDVLLRDSVQSQMLGDVPIGAFLSGGIDSSLIVAQMQKISAKPINTFTIGFVDSSVDEAVFAKKIAKHLGTNHTEAYFSTADLISLVNIIPSVFCEPFADTSQLPTLLVSQLARQDVKVVLGGDGGDELFLGYSRYRQVDGINRILRHLPRNTLASLVQKIEGRDSLLKLLNYFINYVAKDKRLTGDRAVKILRILKSRNFDDLNAAVVRLWDSSVVRKFQLKPIDIRAGGSVPSGSLIEFMSIDDLLNYLPNDILVKIDRSAMAYGLEGRSPFLDVRLIEFALSLNVQQRMINNRPKGILRGLLKRYVPSELSERPKQGFGCPVSSWLRGPLMEWGHDLIERHLQASDDLLDMREIERKWNEHISLNYDWGNRLWVALVFLSWLDKNEYKN
jgi:asparagine synthase (glutamine-hydrolysing)